MTQDAALLGQLDNEAQQTNPSSAFVAIGGAGAVSAVVEEFYSRLLADPATTGFFTPLVESDGLAALKRHQVLMLTKVLGGPDRYAGRDLQTSHGHLAITDETYRRVSLHLLTVMHDFKVPMDILQAADGILGSVRPLVVTGAHGDAQ
ncbi:group 1 truncated hemoglobin [Dactylosporangium sp. NPDC048998]|uniref:group I truncated hemoglobin n=1 Tax=Dactylosporangium sp. NPDC048998 TaxID=3363976 RepID=UPI003714A11E